MAKISLVIDQSHSLKEKRMVLRRIKDRVRERLHVSVNEVGEHDIWQRAELGCRRGRAADRAQGARADRRRRARRDERGRRADRRDREDVTTFDAERVPFAPIDDRTGAGDKAQGGDDWVPTRGATRRSKQ